MLNIHFWEIIMRTQINGKMHYDCGLGKSILLRCQYSFSAIPVKIPTGLLIEIWQTISEICMETQLFLDSQKTIL